MFFSSTLFFFRRWNNPGPSKFWRRRRVFRMSAHFFGRKRNCYSISLRYVHRAMQFARIGRKLRMKDLNELAHTRLKSAAEELGTNSVVLQTGLQRSNILLNKKSLADLAIWEPRTFKALNNFAWTNCVKEGVAGINNLGDPPKGVILRGMVRK